MSQSTAQVLKNHLKGVLEEGGTGSLANPKVITAAGKTATAETGIIKEGQSVTNTWFCGFFPFENPKYVVSIIVEDSIGKEKQAMEIFKELNMRLLNR